MKKRVLAQIASCHDSIGIMASINDLTNEEEVIEISKAIKPDTSINYISITKSGITDKGTKELANALRGNTTITSINLSDNNIGSDGVEALAELLPTCCNLHTLTLANAGITTDSVCALADVLNKTRLTKLDISSNMLDNKVLEELGNALKDNTTITIVDLTHNNFDDEAVKAFTKAIATNSTITSLRCNNSNLTDVAEDALRELILLPNSNILECSVACHDLEARCKTVSELAEEWAKHCANKTSLKSKVTDFIRYTSAIKCSLGGIDRYCGVGYEPDALISSFDDYVKKFEAKQASDKATKESADLNRVQLYMGIGAAIGVSLFGISLYALRGTTYSPNGILHISLGGLSSAITGVGVGYFLSTLGSSEKDQGAGPGK